MSGARAGFVAMAAAGALAVLAPACTFVKMAPGGQDVRVVSPGQLPAGCEKRGEVEVSVKDRLGPYERVSALAVANHVAALTTDRRALGLSPLRGGFFEAPLALQEAPFALSASGDLATLRTRVRLLVFRAGSARWSERNLGLSQ